MLPIRMTDPYESSTGARMAKLLSKPVGERGNIHVLPLTKGIQKVWNNDGITFRFASWIACCQETKSVGLRLWACHGLPKSLQTMRWIAFCVSTWWRLGMSCSESDSCKQPKLQTILQTYSDWIFDFHEAPEAYHLNESLQHQWSEPDIWVKTSQSKQIAKFMCLKL